MHYLKWKNMTALLFAAFIWGVAFVAQSVGMDYIGPFTFNGIRCMIGSLVLFPCIFVFKRMNKEENTRLKEEPKDLWRAGVLCGIVLFIATNSQQIGLQYTTAGKAGFITALYIVFVPIIGLFLKKKCGWNIWLSVLIALVGFYFLSITEGVSRLSKGDFYVLICALVFPFHIWLVNYYAPKVDGIKLSCIQFFVCGGLSLICMAVFENPQIANIIRAGAPILYAGVLSCGVAYTLQIIGQRDFNPTIASLLMSFESVFSVLAGWILLGQAMSTREIGGCILIFTGVILAQIPIKEKERNKENFLQERDSVI